MLKSVGLLINLGYSKKDAEDITSSYQLVNYKDETLYKKINENFNYLNGLGYTKTDVIKMTKSLPSLYGLSKETIEDKISFLISLGYTKTDVIKMTKLLPSLYGLSKENIEEKIRYLKEIGLESIVINDTKKLMQSAPLTYARYEFLTKEKCISIDEFNCRKLFCNETMFKKQYGVSKEVLLKKYSYEDYKEMKKCLIKKC